MSLRFSLLGLIALVTFAAVACQALVHPGGWWTSIVISATAAMIGVQLMRAVLLPGEACAGALGWLVFAIGYLVITTGPGLGSTTSSQLLSSRGLEYAQVHWRKESVQNVPVLQYQAIDLNTGAISPYAGPNSIWIDGAWNYSTAIPLASVNAFQLSGHWLFAWIAGWLGAIVARHLERRSRLAKMNAAA